MPTALQLAHGRPDLIAAVLRCRKILGRRALVGAAASAVPLPGLDWAVDAALLSKLIPEMNTAFGLSADQLARLPAPQRDKVHQAATAIGSLMIGKLVTRDLVVRAIQRVGARMVAKRLARFVPFAGQAVSAALGYGAIRYLGEEHLKDCVKVALAVLPAPVPQPIGSAPNPAPR